MAKKTILTILLVAVVLTIFFAYFNHHFFLTFPFSILVSWGFITGFSPTRKVLENKSEVK